MILNESIKNRIDNRFYFFSIILINIFNALIFLNTIQYYNPAHYIFFFIIILIYINYTILTWEYFTEIFLCVFLYLGLWLKFSINVVKQFQINIINEGSNFFYETNVHLLKLALKNNFEDVLIKIIFGLLTILITIILFKKIFDIDFKKKFRINNTNNFEIFFKKKTFLILTIYFSFIFLLILLNGIFDIVHLGKKINFEYKDKIFKFIFILLIPLSLCFILDIIKKRKKFYNIFFLLSIFLLIIAATTLYSRSAILTLTPLLIVYFLIYKNKINLNF